MATFGSGATKIQPSTPAPYINGFQPSDILPAQWLNWFLANLTGDNNLGGTALNAVIAELDNLVTGAGLVIAPGNPSQVYAAIVAMITAIRTITSISATGLTSFGAFTLATYIKYTGAGAATFDISAGATAAGTELVIDNLQSGANTVTIQTAAGQTAILGLGSVRLVWDGTQWCKNGGYLFKQIWTSGASTWKTPFKTSYKVTCVGGGGGGGGVSMTTSFAVSGGGGGGGTAISILAEAAGATLTYSVGAAGAAGSSGGGNGGVGGNSTVNDGTVTLQGTGGSGGNGTSTNNNIQMGGNGGIPTGADLLMKGSAGLPGMYIYNWGVTGGLGGCSSMGGGANSQGWTSNNGFNGSPGGLYGGGGSGAYAQDTSSHAQTGGAGGAGVIVIEF
jgi:hypothetical protein